MARPRHNDIEHLDRVLHALPDGYDVWPVGMARFVLGPTGAHVVALDDGRRTAPDSLGHLANLVRDALAQHETWVPFIHAMLVTDRRSPVPPATRVPPGMVRAALLDGPPTLDEAVRLRLVAAVSHGALDPVPSLPAGSQPLSA